MLLRSGPPAAGNSSTRQSPGSSRACTQLPRTTQRCRAFADVAASLVPLADVADGISPLGLVLPGLGAAVGGALVLRFSLYSQLEVITAKMLSKYVPSGGARGATVLQLGGGTRELYYYPKDVVLVVNVGPKVNRSLMEQAGVSAAVPTQAKQQPVTDLAFQPDGSVDAVIALGVLGQLGSAQERQACLRECARVLRPGMPLVFVESVREGGSPLRGLVGISSGDAQLPSAALQQELQQDPAFSFTQWDVALEGQDPHAVGVAVRSERPLAARRGDEESSRQRSRAGKQPKTAKGFSSQGSSSSGSQGSSS